MSELRSYRPSLRDQIAWTIAGKAGDWFGAGRYAQQDIAGKVGGLVDFVPGIGEAAGIDDAYRDYQGGDYGLAAAGLGLTAAGAIPGVGDAVAAGGRKVMQAVPHQKAAELAQALRDRGINIGDISNSTNRHGEYSAYIDAPFGRIRVSDHSNNANFDTSAVNIIAGSDLDVNMEADRIFQRYQEGVAQSAAKLRARDEATRPFADMYRAASNDAQRDAILRQFVESGVYPGPRNWREVSRDDRRRLRNVLTGG